MLTQRSVRSRTLGSFEAGNRLTEVGYNRRLLGWCGRQKAGPLIVRGVPRHCPEPEHFRIPLAAVAPPRPVVCMPVKSPARLGPMGAQAACVRPVRGVAMQPEMRCGPQRQPNGYKSVRRGSHKVKLLGRSEEP
jgi:hypothetical protein